MQQRYDIEPGTNIYLINLINLGTNFEKKMEMEIHEKNIFHYSTTCTAFVILLLFSFQ